MSPLSATTGQQAALKRLLREPLVHFLLLGALLFGVWQFAQDGRGATTPSKEIRLTVEELTQLALVFQSQWRREPTPEEFGRLVENRVQEEILYREALAMGLDKDDTIVKRRMAQKMQFLAEDVGAAREPERSELAGVVREEQRQVRAAHSRELPSPVLLAGPPRRPGA